MDKPVEPRKPYASPTLKTFGSLTDITEAVGNMSMNSDGGSMGNTKTA